LIASVCNVGAFRSRPRLDQFYLTPVQGDRHFFYNVPAQPIPDPAIRDLEGVAKAAADSKQIAPSYNDIKIIQPQERRFSMFAPKAILVPTDFSEYSDRAIKEAVDIAAQNNAKIYLLHVVDKLQQCAIDYCIPIETMMKVQSDSEKEAVRKMQEEANKILQTRKIEVAFDIKSGTPYEEILKEQQERKADLIVIASHGRTGILKSLIGTVAERVMREAKCPVLLVR
jgi:universal stress protein A